MRIFLIEALGSKEEPEKPVGNLIRTGRWWVREFRVIENSVPVELVAAAFAPGSTESRCRFS